MMHGFLVSVISWNVFEFIYMSILSSILLYFPTAIEKCENVSDQDKCCMCLDNFDPDE